ENVPGRLAGPTSGMFRQGEDVGERLYDRIMSRPHRALLVDDDDMVRTGLRAILKAAGDIDVVGEAADGDEVVPAVQRHAPDVVLMDLRMPRMDGVTATASVRALPQAPQVVVLTSWDVDQAVLRAVGAGAVGFLLKSSGPEEIMMAVRAAATGDSVLSPRSARKLLNHLNRDVATPERRRAVDLVNTLSDREREVVVRVAQGLSNARVAQQLYVSEGTVKTHLASAQSRLGVRNRVEVAVLAERAGLLTG